MVDTQNKAVIEGKISYSLEKKKKKNRVRQGDSLSMKLSNLVLKAVFRGTGIT